MKEKYKYLAKNTAVFAISSFCTKVLSFLLVPLYTNVLSTEEYGTADMITTVSTLMVFIFTINIADAVLRFGLERKERQEEILSYGVKVLCIGTLVAMLFLGMVWWSGITDWDMTYYVFILGYYIATAIYQIMTNYLRAIDKVSAVAVAGVVSSLVMILSNILFLVVVKIGIYGYLMALIIGPIVGTVYAMTQIGLPIRTYFTNCCDAPVKREMVAYCVPLIFNNIALWINAFLDRFFVISICGTGQNGIYAIANKIPTVLSLCYTVFSQAWNLSAIKEFDKEDKEGFFSGTYQVYNSAIVAACSVLILMNIPLARFLYAKDFFGAWEYSSILLISVMFNAMTAFLGSVFSAVKKNRVIATTTLISAGVNIVLNALLIPVMGPLGAAIATAACYAVMWLARYIAAKRFIKLKISLWRDVIAYGLLVLQVVFEHMNDHFYLGQFAVVAVILILYRKNFMSVVLGLWGGVRKKISGSK